MTTEVMSSSQKKVFAKDSFDRFGDDLTELILSYLTLEDKVRLECVSKQWRRLVFNKQFCIDIFDQKPYFYYKSNNPLNKLYRRINGRIQLDVQSLESLVKKCPNIRKVCFRFDVNSDVLSLIGQYCLHIKSLTLLFVVQCMDFFLKYGHKLEELKFDYDIEDNYVSSSHEILVEQILKLCPNLRTVDLKVYYRNRLNLLKEDKDFLPKLDDFQNYHFGNDWNINPKNMNILTDKYSKTMMTLNVCFGYMTREELKTCIDCIARFENLKELSLKIYHIRSTEPIDDCLSLIGQKCNKLLKLQLIIESSVPISQRLLNVFTEFKAIRKLKIYLAYNQVLSGSVECFRHCKQLIELHLEYSKLTEHFFTNVELFVPKFQSLDISTGKQFSDSFINSFQSMKIIQRVELYDNHPKYKTWYFGKCLTELLLSPMKKDVIRLNENCDLIINYDLFYMNLK